MSEEVTMRGLLRDELEAHPTFSDTTIADRVLTALKVAAKPRMLLLSLVGDVVGNLRREEVRESERIVFGGSKRKVLSDIPIDALSERKTLMDMTFAVGDGRFVRWGDATVEDHEARIEMLAKLRSGIDRTMSQHLEAIAQIKAHKVACLNEIQDVAA